MLAPRRYARGCWSLALSITVGCDAADRPLALDAEDAKHAVNGSAGLDAPTALALTTVSASRIELAWQDNASRESGFEVQRSVTGSGGAFAVLTTTGANVTAHGDAGLAPLTQYCYRVRAFRTSGGKTSYSAVSSTACATTPGPPLAPSNVRATSTSDGVVVVRWADNSSTEDGFRVERSATSSGPWEIVETTPPNGTSYQDPGRAGEQEVCYRVVAFNAHGGSAPSNVDCTTLLAGPSGLAAATAAPGIALTWTDNSGMEDGYEVQRSTDGVTFDFVASVPANSTDFHDTGASSSGTTYWYRVWAFKYGEGFSSFSNVASALGGCTATGDADVCDNGVDDDCDGLVDTADTDCRGQDCSFDHCPPGQVCGYDGYCVSHCGDGEWNGTEGDVDCGGHCDTKCQTGQHCWGHFDCASGFCSFDVCQP